MNNWTTFKERRTVGWSRAARMIGARRPTRPRLRLGSGGNRPERRTERRRVSGACIMKTPLHESRPPNRTTAKTPGRDAPPAALGNDPGYCGTHEHRRGSSKLRIDGSGDGSRVAGRLLAVAERAGSALVQQRDGGDPLPPRWLGRPDCWNILPLEQFRKYPHSNLRSMRVQATSGEYFSIMVVVRARASLRAPTHKPSVRESGSGARSVTQYPK